MNEKPNLDGLQGIFKDYEKQIKKKARRTIAIIVIVCLFFGLLGFLCGRASAYSVPVEEKTLDYFYNSLNIYPGVSSTVSIDAALEGITSLSSAVLSWYADSGRSTLCLVISQAGQLALRNGYWYCSEPGVTVYPGYFDTWNSSGTYSGVSSETVAFTYDGLSYYSVLGISGTFFLYDSYSLYYSSPFLLNDTYYDTPNLDFGSYSPDQRTLNVSKSYNTDNYFINIEASPTEASNFVSVHLTYYDTLGTYTKVIDLSDGIRVYEAGEDDIVVVTINPNLVSQFKYTLTGVEYVAAGSYGTKAVSDLDLIFNEDPYPLPDGYNTITSYTTYNHYSSQGIIGGGIADFNIGYLNDNPNLLSWTDSTNMCYQPFKLKWIAIPNFLWNYASFDFADFNADDYFQLYETYDVVILGVSSSVFNDLYPDWVDPTNTLNNYEFVHAQALVSVEAAITTIMGLESPYRNRDKWQMDFTFTETDTDSCGFVWTRNFLLKQISYFAGDTSERLLEIETRLVDENDGVLTSLQNKLAEVLEQDNGLYNDLIHGISDVVYAIDKLDFSGLGVVSEKLDRIIGYLDFDTEIDINKLLSPWKELFQIGKGLFDNSQFMWRNMIDSYNVISDGLEVDPNYSDNVLLPTITGPVPLFPSIAPNPLLPILTPVPTLVPISSGGG